MKRIAPTVVLLLLFAPKAFADEAPKVVDEANIFEKRLADGRQLIVTRREVSHVPLTPAEKQAELERSPAGTTFIESKHFYRYVLSLVSPRANGQGTRQDLWQREASDGGSEKDDVWQISIFDVNLYRDTAVVLYKVYHITNAEVVPAGEAAATRPLASPWMYPIPISRIELTRDFEPNGWQVANEGRIEGSPDDGTLAVVVHDTANGDTLLKSVKDAKGYTWTKIGRVEAPAQPTSRPGRNKSNAH